MNYSLSAQNLVKHFDGKIPFTAVKNLSFDLSPGESVAFLGPNGAGKSTTIKLLCGILTPSSGEAFVNGHKAGSLEANKSIGLVFGTRSQLYMHMTVYQCLDLISEIYYMTGELKKKRINELSELFEIGPLVNKRVRTLSLGQRMRCEIVAALIHKPQVLLADEATIGLDIIAKNSLRELIRRWQKEEKSTLLLTSHDLSDVEALCDRSILIDHGEKKFDGKLSLLKGELSDLRRIEITVSDLEVKLFNDNLNLFLSKTSNEYIHAFEIRLNHLSMADALSLLSTHYGNKLQDIKISEVSLEEVLAERFKNYKS